MAAGVHGNAGPHVNTHGPSVASPPHKLRLWAFPFDLNQDPASSYWGERWRRGFVGATP